MGILPEELGQIRMGQGQHSRLERKWTVQQWDPKQVLPLLSHGLLTVGLTIPHPVVWLHIRHSHCMCPPRRSPQ